MFQITFFVSVLNGILALLIAVAFVYCVWTLTFYIWEMGTEIGKRHYKTMFLDGVLAFLLLLCAYSVVASVEEMFNISPWVTTTME